MTPFVLGGSADGLRVHFLWHTLDRKELIEQEVREVWASGDPERLNQPSRVDPAPGEIQRRIEWLFRKSLDWSERTDPKGGESWPPIGKTRSSMGRLTWGLLAWVVLGAAVVWGLSVLPPEEAATPPVAPEETRRLPQDLAPGIVRVGRGRAAQLWRDLTLTPGVQRWFCNSDLCTVMFDPVVWAGMELDPKRDLTTDLGIAFAYGKDASWVEVRDLMTNRRLSLYSTQADSAHID
jgi:hypothetical protein